MTSSKVHAYHGLRAAICISTLGRYTLVWATIEGDIASFVPGFCHATGELPELALVHIRQAEFYNITWESSLKIGPQVNY